MLSVWRGVKKVFNPYFPHLPTPLPINNDHSLTKFDCDSLKWTNWLVLSYAIIHRSNMTSFDKMTHLQQNVTGKAKSAIAGFRYNGSHHHEALRCLENRFGKPHVVVQAHLNNLTKMSPVSENDTNSISNYSRAINTIDWTIEDLGYDDDLKAASNVKTAVEKFPTSMILK